ncbi:TPA: hypothetical protein SAN82_001629 [Pseudomonas putida]|nr:hypothetical protein [Pseudomonas putida]
MINVSASPENVTTVRSPLCAVSKLRLIVLELFTVSILLGLTFWSVGPLIEEWGLFGAFNVHGLAYLQTYAPFIPMRPLHLTAYALQWLLGAGQPVGVALGTGLLMVIRYLVARWAVTPFFSGYDRWVIAVLAATLVFWPGVWLGRYGSAQLSAILFFVALGFSVRLYQRWSTVWAIGCAFSVALMLAMYQGLALCLAAIPFASLLWSPIGDAKTVSPYSKYYRTMRICFAVGAGCVLYGIFWLVVSSKMGGSGYEGTLAADSARLLTLAGLWTHIKSAYMTAYGQAPHLLPLLLMMVFLLCKGSLEKLETPRSRLSAGVLICTLLGLLPIFSMIYVSVLHIGDVDRVLFPVSGGFVLVCISLMAYFRKGNSNSLELFNASVVVVAVLTSSVLVAHGVRDYVQLQRSVLTQTWSAVEKGDWKSVMIRDTTGTLGDVYTFLGSTLGDASTALGRNLTASICTPLAVDRLHPVAQRFPITTTPRCEELPVTSDSTLVLTARWINGVLIIEP